MEYRRLKPFEFDDEIYATMGQRLANYIIDYIIQIIIVIGISFVIAFVAMLTGNEAVIARMEAINQIEKYALGAVIVLVYYNFFEIFFAQSVGKFITNTIVVNEMGEKPTTNEILNRSLFRLIPFEQFSFLFIPNKGWHDSISKTYVVKKQVLEERKRAHNSLEDIGKSEE